MVHARRIKQATYAGGCMGVFIFFVVVVSVLTRGGTQSTTPTPLPTTVYEPLILEQTDSVRHGDFIDIVARIRNPNPRAGTGRYVVTFVLFDTQEKELAHYEETVYILPGSVQYVSAIGLPLTAALSRIDVVLPPPTNFIRLPDGQDLPTFSSFLRERSIRALPTTQFEEQTGIVSNTSTLDWERVEVAAVALDNAGKVVGIGKTFVGQLRAGQQREFTVQWPSPLTPTQRVIVIPTTNMYAEENILKVIGDPSLLR